MAVHDAGRFLDHCQQIIREHRRLVRSQSELTQKMRGLLLQIRCEGARMRVLIQECQRLSGVKESVALIHRQPLSRHVL